MSQDLENGVGADQAIVFVREIQERRRDSLRAEVEALVGVVREDPDAVPAAVLEERFCSPRRIVQPVGLLGELRYSARVPGGALRAIAAGRAASPRRKTRAAPSPPGAEDLGDLLEVRPQRHHLDHAVARIDQQLRREHQRVDAGAGDRDLARETRREAARGTRPAPRATPGCRGCGYRKVSPAAIEALPAFRMKSGVGSSGSPTQNGSTSVLPKPSLYSSRIFDAVSARTAARAESGVSIHRAFMTRPDSRPVAGGRPSPRCSCGA